MPSAQRRIQEYGGQIIVPASQPWFFASLNATPALRASSFVVLICTPAFAQTPRIDSLSPSQGPIAGGTIVTIKGANFTGAAVTLDRAGATPLSSTDSEIRVQMPRHDNGYAVISVRTPGGVASSEFLYVPV